MLLDRIWPMLGHLNRLKQRMERRRFPQGDKLYSRVVAAHNELHSLAVILHYMTCDGTGGPLRPS